MEYGLSAERPQCLRRRLWGQWFVEPRGDLPFQPKPSTCYNNVMIIYKASGFEDFATLDDFWIASLSQKAGISFQA